MYPKISVELMNLIANEQFVAFGLPSRLETSSGGLVECESNDRVLSLVENIFKCAGSLAVIGSKFGAEAFYGEGHHIHAIGERSGKHVLTIRYQKGLAHVLRNFICNIADDPLIEEPRGTLCFRLQEQEFVREIAPFLGAPFFIRNYSAHYRNFALRYIREVVSTDGIAIVISDRSPLRSFHCFGNSPSLVKAAEKAEAENSVNRVQTT